MKHIFVINPQAGVADATATVMAAINNLNGSVDCETYTTTGVGDATRFVSRRAASGEPVRFYACGGDGTLNEVAAGAVGHPAAEVSCFPVGSGNDYVKYYGGKEAFLDLPRLVDGVPHQIDIMRVGDRYSVNVCNFGFDAIVCRTMVQVRRKWLIGGSNAYTTGIVKALFNGRRTPCTVTVDGVTVHEGDMLLCTLGNGRYVGGAYMCSPLSVNDDGLIEVCLFKPMSLLRLANLIGDYRKGSFIHRTDLQGVMTYLRGSDIEIHAPAPIDFCIDGEMLFGSSFRVQQLPRALTFIAPRPL